MAADGRGNTRGMKFEKGMAHVRTSGRGDFGRWDPMDEPTEGLRVDPFALNHGPLVMTRGVWHAE